MRSIQRLVSKFADLTESLEPALTDNTAKMRSLFLDTLKGHPDSFLIFLDLLEETNPKERKSIENFGKSSNDIFKLQKLFEIFSEVLGIDQRKLPENIANIKGFEFGAGDDFILFKNAHYYIPNEIIFMPAMVIKIGGYDSSVISIKKNNSDDQENTYVIYSRKTMRTVNDEEAPQCKVILEEFKKKAEEAIKTLMSLFPIPEVPITHVEPSSDLNENDDTKAARQALDLGNTKYPKDLSREGVLPDGRKVRLLPSTVKGTEVKHRLEIECPHCQQWVPTGRTGQHTTSCFKKKKPLEFSQNKELVLKDLEKNINTKKLDNKQRFENSLAISDLYQEMIDNNNETLNTKISNQWRFKAYRYLAQNIAKKECPELNGKVRVKLISTSSDENNLIFPYIYEVFDGTKEYDDLSLGGSRHAIISINQDGTYEVPLRNPEGG